MTNRCPDCNKFVSLNLEEPEVESLEVDLDGTVTAEVRLVLTCADCGDEGKENTFSLEAEASDDLKNHIEAHQEAKEDFDLEVEETSLESNDRFQDVDRNGKKINKYRYMKHLYGVSLDAEVTCSCGATFSVQMEDEEQASGFTENWY